MRKLLVAAAFVLSLSCTGSRGPVLPPAIPTDYDPSIAIIADSHMAGHACPVEGLGVFTNRHVVEREGSKGVLFYVMWSQGPNWGVAEVVSGSNVVDIVTLDLDGTYTSFPRGHAAVGDTVYWYEYDFRTRDNILRGRLRHATILRVVAGHVLLDESPVGGASGTCLLDSNGGAIAVINGGWETDDGYGEAMAIMLAPHLEGM